MQAPQGISPGSSRSSHPFKASGKSPSTASTAVLSAMVPSARALTALKNAVTLNNVHAMYALGMYYAVAKETATTLPSAHNAATPATAPRPSAAAATSATPTPTTAEIESLWTTAAIAGHASAQRELGLFYTAASSSSPPCTDGVVPTAASAAAATAAFNGRMALDSLSGMAIALLDAAAEQGDTVALSNAGCSALAVGDYAKATAYLSKAALNGDVQACCEFGWMLMNGKATDTWREKCDFVAASKLPIGVRNRARPRVVKGMKLEARDRANKSLICVATITEVKWPAAPAAATDSSSSSSKGPTVTATTAMPFTATTAATLARPTVKIHFDGWGRNYDYTTTLGNEDLFYVGYCADNGKKLELPRRTYDSDEILWDRSGSSSTMSSLHKWGKYLKDSKANAIPKEWADGSVGKEATAAAAWGTYLRGLFGVLRKGSTADLIPNSRWASRWASPWLIKLPDKANESLHQTLRKDGPVFADELATATTAPTTTVTAAAPSTTQEAGAASTNGAAESCKDDAADGDSTTAVTEDTAVDADAAAAAAVATLIHGTDPFGAAEWFFQRAAAELSPDAAFALATLKRVREASGDAADAIAAVKAGMRYSKEDAESCAKYVARDKQIMPAKPEDQFVGKATAVSKRWEVLRNAGSAGCSDADFELSKEMFAEYNRDVTFMHATAFERGERDGVSVKEWCAARIKALGNSRTNPTEEATPRTSYWLYSKVIERAAVLAEQVAADESAVTCSLGGARQVNTRDFARQGHAHFLAGQLRQEQGNTKTALEHFKAASLANVPGATIAVGKCLLNKQNVACKYIPNGDEDDDLCDMCKDEGFEAQSALPALGQTPLTAVANPCTWFKKEADAGNPEAMVLLGNCHLTGTGVATKDPECAVALYQRAVELNCGAGMNALGKCFQDGVGVAADPTKARALFVAASASGSAPVSASSTPTANKVPPTDANATLDGNCNLALCFVNGIGGPCNHAYGVRLLTEAAQKGSARAHALLGMICTQKSQSALLSPPTTLPTARWLFRKAADANDSLGLYKYGMLLVRPHLQQSSFATVTTSSQPPLCCGASGFRFHEISGECKQLHCGTALLLQAAQSGVTEAYSHAANGLRAMAGSDSRTLSKGYAKLALITYLRGDDLGDASSQYSLAEYYLSISEGDRALHFAGRASDNGFAAATVLLGTICDSQGKHAAAANHYEAAANAGNLEGIHALAWCFKLGRGVQQDNGKAASLFRSASTKGHLPSRFESWVCCQQGHHGGGSTNGVGSSSSSSMVRRGSASNAAAFELSGRIADPSFVAFLNACKQGTMDSNSDALAQWPIKEERMMLVAQYYTDASAATFTAAFGASRRNHGGSSNVGETLVAMHTAVEPSTGGTGSALAASNGHLASLQTVLAHRLSHVLPALARDRKFDVANVITDFNFGITLQDRHGKMMIQLAAKHGHWNCVRWLMEQGALAGFGTWSSSPSSSSGSGASAAAPAAVSTSMDGSQEIILDAFDEFATLVAEGGPADVETDVLVRRATLLAAAAADVRMDLEQTSPAHADDGGSDASPAVFAGFTIMNAVGRMMRIADGKPCLANVRRTFWTSESKRLLVLLLQRLEADGLFCDSSQTHKRNWRCHCYGCPGQTSRNSSRNVLTLTMLTFLAGPARALVHLLKHATPSDDVVPAGLVRTMVETMSQFLNSSTVHMYANAEPKRLEPRSPAEKAQRNAGHHMKPFVCFPGKCGMTSSPGGFSSEDAHLFNEDLLSTLSVRDAANAAMDVLQASTVWVSTQHHTEAADTCLLNAANRLASSLHATITESKSANAAFKNPFPASVALPADLAGKEAQLTFEAAMVHDLQTALAVESLSERHASAYSMADILNAVVDVTGGRGSDESGGGARGGGDSNGSNRTPHIIAAADIAAAAEAKLLKACGADTLWSKPFGILELLLSKVDAVKRFGSNDHTEPLKKTMAALLARVTGAANMARAKRKAFRKSLQNARGERTPSIATSTSTSTSVSSAPATTAARSKKKRKGKRKAGACDGGDTRAGNPDSAGGGEAAVGGDSALETMAVVPEQDEPEPALSAAERLETALQSVSEFEVEALRVEQLCTLLDKYPALDQIGKCGICGDRETKTDALTNVAGKNIGGEHFKNKPCGCRYCKTCLSSWIKAKLDDRHICIACPSRGLESNGCQYMLYAADIKRLGTEHDFNRYIMECALFLSLFLSVDSFETALFDGLLFFLPFFVFLFGANKRAIMISPRPSFFFLNRYKALKSEDHRNRLVALAKDPKFLKYVEAKQRCCPHCFVLISRSDGCDDMLCTCGKRFRWNDKAVTVSTQIEKAKKSLAKEKATAKVYA